MLKSADKSEFSKVFTRIKFELINSIYDTHEINEKYFWDKIVKNGIPRENWDEFILEEIENPKFIRKSHSNKNTFK